MIFWVRRVGESFIMISKVMKMKLKGNEDDRGRVEIEVGGMKMGRG